MTIPTKDRDGNDLDIAATNRAGVEYPLSHLVDAAGALMTPAKDSTLVDLVTAAQAIQAAAEALNTKALALNTGAVAGTVSVSNLPATQPVSGTVNVGNLPSTQTVAGTVALDAPTLAALEIIQATTGGLTNAELRAAPVPVSGAVLDALQTLLTTLAGSVYAADAPFVNGSPGVLMLAKRRDADTTSVSADGDLTTLNMDEMGRLKVSTQPASYAVAAGNITASGQTVFLNVERASNVTISMVATSLTGHNATFEYSPNSTNGTDGNWYGVQAARSNANTVDTTTGVLTATPAYGWELSVNAYKWIRVRATAHTGGTAAYTITPGAYATEPIPAVQVTGNQPITHAGALAAGTARVGFQAASGIWYDDTSTALAANATFTGTSRDATVTATATAWANAATYAQEVVASAEQDVSFTLALEVSRDNATWRRVKTLASAAVSGGGHYAEIVHRPSWRYWRVLVVNGATAAARTTVGSIAKAA